MLGREVAPIVGVEDIGDAAHDPAWIFLAPNRLTQREGSVQCRRVFKRKKVSGYSPAVIVDDRGEPRLGRFAVWADQQNVERRVVCRPDGVGSIRFTTGNQLECVAVGFGFSCARVTRSAGSGLPQH